MGWRPSFLNLERFWNIILQSFKILTLSKNFDGKERKRSTLMLVGPFFLAMGFSEKLWSKKIQFQMQGPKTHQKHAQQIHPRRKICFPKGTVPGKDSSQEYVNFVKKITKKPKPSLFDWGIFQHETHSTHHFQWLLCFTIFDRDLCVPSLKLVRRHGACFVAEMDKTALFSGRI